MLVLLVLTPVFTHMSANVQGAIVIYGVFSIADFGELLYLVRVRRAGGGLEGRQASGSWPSSACQAVAGSCGCGPLIACLSRL